MTPLPAREAGNPEGWRQGPRPFPDSCDPRPGGAGCAPSSYWNRSSRRTSNRGRSDTDRNGQLMKRWTVWRERSFSTRARVIDIDLRSYFDNVRHDRLLAKVAQRVDDADVMHLLKIMLKASGKHGVP